MANFPPTALDARCARHPNTRAFRLCARCGDQLCEACLPANQTLCTPCREREPLFDVTPLPWESAELPLGERWFGTFWALLRPWKRADAFARGSLASAFGFAATITLPLSLLSQIIPATRTLLFVPALKVQILRNASASEITWDVLAALGIGVSFTLLASLTQLLSVLTLSLLQDARIWTRHALYWSWLAPFVGANFYYAEWLWPNLGFLAGVLNMTALFAWWLSLFAVTRKARKRGVLSALTCMLIAPLPWLVVLGAETAFLAGFAPPVVNAP